MPTVMKFGGTSVADAHAFENVARIVASQNSVAPVVVVSAMSGVTDALLAATVAAGEGRADGAGAREAIASLEQTFHRHHKTAAEIVKSTSGVLRDFIGRVRPHDDRTMIVVKMGH